MISHWFWKDIRLVNLQSWLLIPTLWLYKNTFSMAIIESLINIVVTMEANVRTPFIWYSIIGDFLRFFMDNWLNCNRWYDRYTNNDKSRTDSWISMPKLWAVDKYVEAKLIGGTYATMVIVFESDGFMSVLLPIIAIAYQGVTYIQQEILLLLETSTSTIENTV